jgi:hypothetical protein
LPCDRRSAWQAGAAVSVSAGPLARSRAHAIAGDR